MEAVAATASPSDAQLGARTLVGDQQALLSLYEAHFGAVYDFALRVVRDGPLAAHVAETAFARVRKAAGDFGEAPLFALARVCALDALHDRARARPADLPEREGHQFTQMDAQRLSDPSAVLFDRELIELVWDSAAALTPDEYSLLDLHIRHDLTVEELAYHCGLNGSASTRLSRLCRGLDDAVISTLVVTRWRKSCARLDLALSDLEDPGADKIRLVVRQHVRECEQCRESEQRFVSPTEVFGGFAAIPAPPRLRRDLLKRLNRPEPREHSSRLRRLTFGIL
jgi:DNA-directed RNA polymerase specialized sigma24 family protein